MGHARRFAVRVLPALLLAPLVWAADPAASGPDRAADAAAEFFHQGGWDASGALRFACDATGIRFAEHRPITVSLEARKTRLVVYDTWINTTLVRAGLPARLDVTQEQQEHRHDFDQTPLSIAWGADGRAAARAGPAGLRAAATARVASGEPAVPAIPTGILYPALAGNRIDWVVHDVPGPARLVASDAEAWTATGHVLLTLDSASVHAADGFALQLPRFKQQQDAATSPVVIVRTEHYTHALLEAEDAVLHIPGGFAVPACGGLQADVLGTATFRAAQGWVRLRGQSVEFANRDVTLNGSYAVREELSSPAGKENPFSGRPVDATTTSHVEGSFVAAGLDYAPIAPAGPDAVVLTVGISLALLLLGAAAWMSEASGRVVGFLFTRISPQRALQHPTRSAILGLVETDPGLILRDLVRRTGRPYAVVRHHVGVLAAAGHVRTLRAHKALHLYPRGASLPSARRALALAMDPPVRHLADLVTLQDASMAQAVGQLRQAFGLSRMGAWKAVRRAEANRFIQRVRDEGGVWLRAPSP